MNKHMSGNGNSGSTNKIRWAVWILLIPFLISGHKAYSHPFSYEENTKLSIEMRNRPLVDVLDAIKAQSEFSFVVNQSEVDLNRKVTVNVNGKTVFEVLNTVLKGTDLRYEVNGKHILISKNIAPEPAPVVQQQPNRRKVTGTVTDPSGEPIIGAAVTVPGQTGMGAITNIDGQFEIMGPLTAFTLEISCLLSTNQLLIFLISKIIA